MDGRGANGSSQDGQQNMALAAGGSGVENGEKVTVKDLIMKRFLPQEKGRVKCKFCPKYLKTSNITEI